MNPCRFLQYVIIEKMEVFFTPVMYMYMYPSVYMPETLKKYIAMLPMQPNWLKIQSSYM